MKRNIFKHICQGTLLAAVALCTVSCEDELDSELFTKYSYLMDNGWQENIEMPINDDNTVDLPVYFGVNGTSGNDKDIIVKLDVDARVVNLPEYEIGQLGRSMNQMSEQLEQTISELKTANAQLKKDIDHKIQYSR